MTEYEKRVVALLKKYLMTTSNRSWTIKQPCPHCRKPRLIPQYSCNPIKDYEREFYLTCTACGKEFNVLLSPKGFRVKSE